jgi:hypothetical protein
MKTSVLFSCAFFLISFVAQAQQESLLRFVDKYKNDKAFTYAYLSKDLVEIAAETEVAEKDWQKLQQVVQNIGSLSILAADSITNGRDLYREALAAVPVNVFDELLAVRDGNDQVRIWAQSEGSTVTDVVVLVGSAEEFVLLCFAGELQLGNLMELGDMLDAEQAEHLVETTRAVAVDFQISPNPTSGVFTVTCANPQDALKELTITDLNGRLVASAKMNGEHAQQLQFPELKNGYYVVQIKTADGKVGVKQISVAH